MVMELMRRLARERNRTVVLVTHDNRILDYADRVIHIEDGRINQGGHHETDHSLLESQQLKCRARFDLRNQIGTQSLAHKANHVGILHRNAEAAKGIRAQRRNLQANRFGDLTANGQDGIQ